MHAIAPTFDGKRTVPSPEVTRLMLEMLQLGPGDKVLEIGTGSGYQTQELAKTGAEIHSIELEPWVDSTVITGECVFLHRGDGNLGLESEAPFTAIVATCGIERIPDEWNKHLSDGGRLVCPIGTNQLQTITRFVKQDGELIPKNWWGYTKFQMIRDKA